MLEGLNNNSNDTNYNNNDNMIKITITTRTTRTPAFWGYPPPPHDYPYHWVILDPKSKEDKVKVTNLKKSPKFVEDTERTRFCPQTDRRTDGQGDTSIPPINFVEARGYNNDNNSCIYHTYHRWYGQLDSIWGGRKSYDIISYILIVIFWVLYTKSIRFIFYGFNTFKYNY